MSPSSNITEVTVTLENSKNWQIAVNILLKERHGGVGCLAKTFSSGTSSLLEPLNNIIVFFKYT